MKSCFLCGRRFRKTGGTIALRVENTPFTLAPRPICLKCADREERKASREAKEEVLA